MTPPAARSIQTSVRRLGTLGTALGSQLPGISFFLGLAPPDFKTIALLTSGGTVALFLWVFNQKHARHENVAKGMRFLATAIVFATVYGALFQYLTVGPPAPRSGHERFQIGFGMCSFSLTESARRIAQQQHLDTPEDLMLAFGGYEEGGRSRIWTSWSIFIASSILCVGFVVTYVFWTSGLAFLARSLK